MSLILVSEHSALSEYFSASGINVNYIYSAQFSENQINEQEQIKENERILVNEQGRTSQTGEHFTDYDF